MQTFKYQGSTLAEDGKQDAEVTQCRVGGRTRRECLECFVADKMNVKIKGRCTCHGRPSVISTGVGQRGRDMGIEEGTGK